MIGPELDRLINLLGKLPGLGPRSARRVVLHLLKKRETLMQPLASALIEADAKLLTCTLCGSVDTHEPCSICASSGRDTHVLCVVEDVADLWAMERTRAFKGRYFVLGNLLSALAGITPEQLQINKLVARVVSESVTEVILALPATVDGQTTAHYIADRLREANVPATRLAHGVPLGGELDYLDEGTLVAALSARRSA
jgi:recombination protein RecR